VSGINIPSDSTHLSDLDRADLIEEFGGMVDSQFAKASMMRGFVNVQSITGTDTKTVRRAGKTTLQKLTDGVRPAANKTSYGKATVTVDTVVLARDNQSMLNSFQADFNVRAELAKDHGKELGKFFDQAFLIQGIKSAGLAAPGGLNGAMGAGKNRTLAAANDELDPDKLFTNIDGILTEMQEEDIDTDECAIFVSPTQYKVLMNHDKLMDRDFSTDNGDFADGTIKTIDGCPIVKTNRIPKAAITGHFLSNADNGNAYDVTAAEAKAQAVILHPQSLLAGETIPLQSNIFFSDTEKQWFIDAWMAFGVSNRRPDVCGVVFAA
jgi:N4-gp56 family major capsid protein